MKLTGLEVENVFSALSTLQNEKFDVSTGYSIAALSTEIQKKYNELFQKREKIIKEYADKNENGEVILDSEKKAHIPPETAGEAQEKLNQIYDEIYDINAKYISLDKFDGIKLTLNQIANLKPILDQ